MMFFSTRKSATPALVNLFLALVALQQASTALALPTRGSYGSLARRAAASQSAKKARLARRVDLPAAAPEHAEESHRSVSPLTAPVNSTIVASNATATTPTSTTVEQANEKPRLALTRPVLQAVEVAQQNDKPASDADSNAKKAASIGNGYSMFAANEGIAASATAWVDAQNVTLPSSGINKRELVKRLVPHPGEPSPSIRVDVIGGETIKSFTLVATKTSSAVGVAQTDKNVNIIHGGNTTLPEKHNTTTTKGSEEADSTLLTFSFTLPVSAVKQTNETITLVPGENNSYLPYINKKRLESATKDAAEAACTVPVDDNVLTAVARGVAFTAFCVIPADSQAHKVRIEVDASLDADKEFIKKFKRDSIAFFEAPPAQSLTASPAYTKAEMMSDAWEDCIIGEDAGCLPIPEE